MDHVCTALYCTKTLKKTVPQCGAHQGHINPPALLSAVSQPQTAAKQPCSESVHMIDHPLLVNHQVLQQKNICRQCMGSSVLFWTPTPAPVRMGGAWSNLFRFPMARLNSPFHSQQIDYT